MNQVMIKRSLKLSAVLTLLCLFFSNSTWSQVTFVVERDTLSFADGTLISRDAVGGDNRSQISVFGGYLSPAEFTQFSIDITAIKSSFSTDAVTALESLNTTLSLHTWESINPATGLVVGIRDWSGLAQLSTAGDFAVMLVMTTNTVGSLQLSDQIGIVASSTYSVPETLPPTTVIGFTTTGTHYWDTALMGELGSLTLTAVPEPTTYALIFGIFGLGMVLWRRRR